MKTNFGEFKITTLRETATEIIADCPAKIAEYWKTSIESNPYFDSQKEIFVVFLLNTRNRIIGHNIVSVGTLNSCQAHPREVFRPAIIGAANAIILAHNHPSGDPLPSNADINMTRALVEAGKLLQITVLDHVIFGESRTYSMKEYGFIK